MNIIKKFIPKQQAKYLAAGILAMALCSTECLAQGPEGKSFGFGLIVGEPLGATVKLWLNPVNAFVFDIGGSDFGPTRLDGNYLWHFDPFHSRIAKLYAAPGIAIAFGNGNGPYGGREFDKGNGVGLAVRVMFGLNVIPQRTPLEIFFELGPIIGLSPGGAGFDFAAGIRFYP
jgi:hypothetical protein